MDLTPEQKKLQVYATRTGTRRNLKLMKEAGFRILLTPSNARHEGFRYSCDNDRYAAHFHEKPWDEAAFWRMVDRFAAGADWLVVPDLPTRGLESLEETAKWIPRLRGACPKLLIALQDGMEEEHLEPFVAPDVGFFLGGSTEWKLETMEAWGRWCAKHDAYYHVARVNTDRRMRLAAAAGADSVDGTSASRFAETIQLLANAAAQPDMFSPRRAA